MVKRRAITNKPLKENEMAQVNNDLDTDDIPEGVGGHVYDPDTDGPPDGQGNVAGSKAYDPEKHPPQTPA
jgi:hypothetical protein